MERILTGHSSSHARRLALGWYPVVPHGPAVPHGPTVQQPKSLGLLCFVVVLNYKFGGLVFLVVLFFFFLRGFYIDF